MALEFIGKTIQPINACSMHAHDGWELVYNEKGSGTLRMAENTFSFLPGSVTLCPPGTMHQKVSDSGFEDYYLLLSGAPFAAAVGCFVPRQSEEILQLIRVMHSCFHGYGQTAVCDKLLEAVLSLLEPELEDCIHDPQIRMARRIIIEQFADAGFHISSVAKQLHMNEDHFRRRFKQVTGQCPHRYLQEIRMENAKKLLLHSNLNISDVAYLSGFYDALYFSKVFRKQTGLSPSQWILQVQGGTTV